MTLDTSFGRQGNEYTGDIQNSNADATNPDSSFSNIAYVNGLLGKETNTMYRDSYALTHEGKWAWGDTKLLAQFDKTKNIDCANLIIAWEMLKTNIKNDIK